MDEQPPAHRDDRGAPDVPLRVQVTIARRSYEILLRFGWPDTSQCDASRFTRGAPLSRKRPASQPSRVSTLGAELSLILRDGESMTVLAAPV